MGRAVPVNKNSNDAMMNAAVKYFSLEIHKAVIGTFINIYFFGRTFDKSLLL